MTNELKSQSNSNQSKFYQIRIKGLFDNQWIDWFEGMSITQEDVGFTSFIGELHDQAALHGLLKKIRDLGITLVSVNQVQSQEPRQKCSKKEKK